MKISGAEALPIGLVLTGGCTPLYLVEWVIMEDHSFTRAPDRFGDQMAPMRHEDPLWIDIRYSFRGELGRFGNALNGAIELSAESISQCAVPRTAGEQQQGALVER